MSLADRERQADLARLRGLRPIDDDFMRCIFRDNVPLAELVLRIVTGIPDLTITALQTQKDMKRLVGARSICLDAYATDSAGKKYDMEIQRSDRGAGKHRARYHSSVMDVENLNAGQRFDELPDTFTIFITENDVFGAGQAVYTIERVNTTTGESFDDGEHILYVNGQYRGDSSIGRLMYDFSCCDPDDMSYELLRDAARYYKEDPKGVEVMCRAFEETRNEGAMRHAIETAERMLAKGKYALDEIAEMSGLPLEKVKELATAKSA
ncbi:MAG: PD-(D/E)XK nuclease family transposase [Clostridia bacterium]|nr:PD-(D/E)XK nuclease family transposase [Clostridia bacterium]